MSEKMQETIADIIAADALRDALKDVEATVTAALAHQPEDEAKCGQFLYDALVKCFNIADLACHAARTENGAAVSREAATAENSSAVGNAAKLRDAVKCLMDNLNIHLMMPSEQITINRAELEAMVKDCSEALAAPPRQCDVGTDNEQLRRWKEFCDHYEVDRSPESFARWAQGPHFEEGGNNADK